MGFIAQDIETVLGDGYSVLWIGDNKDHTLSLRYTDVIAPRVRAIQAQQATIQARQEQIEALAKRLTALETTQAEKR